MSDMIERIARAGAIERWGDDEDWEYFTNFARAAIRFMREPTVAMVKAGARFAPDDMPETNALCSWQAMIDAALGEEGGK